VGIDIDADQLEHNRRVREKILGDLHHHRFPPETFDLIVCVDVLEHLDRPALALANLAGALKAGGLLLLGVPEPVSFKGVLAKITPHWMHPRIFRLLTGREASLALDIYKTFYPTYLRGLCSRRRLRQWAAQNGFEVTYDRAYDGHSEGVAARFPGTVAVARRASALVRAVSRGRWDLLAADYVLCLRKSSLLERTKARRSVASRSMTKAR
jgi:SAM-dependent methyltransferase